jgi:hypothetical protein
VIGGSSVESEPQTRSLSVAGTAAWRAVASWGSCNRREAPNEIKLDWCGATPFYGGRTARPASTTLNASLLTSNESLGV